MDTSFGDAKLAVLRLLGDEILVDDYLPVGGSGYGYELLEDAIHAALDAICSRSWKQAITTLTADGETSLFELPVDLIEVESVYDANQLAFIPRIEMAVGDPFISTAGNGWLLYPQGYISFVGEVAEDITVYYSSLWEKPTSDDDLLEPPGICLTPIIYFAASYCLLPDAAQAADIRQFNTKVDSGQPTDNPKAEMSNYLLKRFEIELQRVPQMTKGSQT